MSEQVEICRRKAAGCEWAAIVATNSDDKALFANLARQWLEVADQAQQLSQSLSPKILKRLHTNDSPLPITVVCRRYRRLFCREGK
jgi:hypothetical protein